MTTSSTHQGSCHCGTVKFQADVDASKGIACNCSICARRGTILAAAADGGVTITAGQDALTEYQFGTKRIHHLFCATCGVPPFSWADMKGQKRWMVNVRCLDNFDEKSVDVQHYDGKSIPVSA